MGVVETETRRPPLAKRAAAAARLMFISVGYGRNQQGRMLMRFPTLGSDGGERRLNVLITRAKRRCEVFSSITARGAAKLEHNAAL